MYGWYAVSIERVNGKRNQNNLTFAVNIKNIRVETALTLDCLMRTTV